MTEKLPVNVVILTKNEEAVVARAIASAIADFAEVTVLDSHSDDSTAEVASNAGARVVANTFLGYASQRNFALKSIRMQSEWVLFLDADEAISPELVAELRREFPRFQREGIGMAYMRRKDFFMGKWIRRSSGYPTWFGRLCHAPSVHVEREINEEYHCSKPISRLEEHLLHYPFSKGISHWVDRHNRYSSAEADEKFRQADGLTPRLLLSRDPGLRRKGLKQIYMRLPFRPVAGFLYLYAVRGGFLDGTAGLRFALLRAFYEFLISLKLEECRAESFKKDSK